MPKVKKNSASANGTAANVGYEAELWQMYDPCCGSSDIFTESVVEQATLAWLKSLGWRVTHGLEIAPDKPGAERANGASHKFTRTTGAGAPA